MKERADCKTGGFSLSELLVVISLGAILVGTILPALSTTRDTMNAAVCLGNMHQWGLGLSLYIADQRDYFPYEGANGVPIDSVGTSGFPGNRNAWYNVVPPYLGQPTLLQLYTAGTPPTLHDKSLWICPSGTNYVPAISLSNAQPYFMYGFNARIDPNNTGGGGDVRFQRSQCVAPATTIIFCEASEGPFSSSTGANCPARHSGGGNFVMADYHAEWIAFTNYCRQTAPGCPVPFDAVNSTVFGDWKNTTVYHWFPFRNAPT